MQFQYFALIATFLAATSAAPAAKRDWINDCGDSSFENQSSGGSPSVADCQQLVANIAGGGTWRLEIGGNRQLASYGSCAFAAAHSGSTGLAVAHIGNSDISDLINDSINQFNWNGLVGAKGSMMCQNDVSGGDYQSNIDWALYHT